MKNKSNMKTKPQNLKLIFLLWGVFFSANLAFAQYGRTFKIEGDNLYIYDEEGNLLKQSNSGVIDAQELITYGTFDLKKNRITVKNAEKITIDLKNIENLTRVDRVYGGTLTWNETEKKIEIGSAGSVFIDYYTQDPNSRTETIWSLGIHVNYYGVLQYQGGDAPSEIIVTGEEDLEKEIYLPDGKFPGLRWFNGDGQSLENIIPDGTTRVSLKKLKETGFTHFKVRLRDGTFNELDSGIGGERAGSNLKSFFFPPVMVGKTKSTIRQNKKYNLRGGEFPSGQSDKMATALSSRNRKRGVPCVALLCRGGRVGRYLGTISSL